MYLTGYHGTNQSSANRIIRNQKFHLSNGRKEWLGNGIYFYIDFADSLDWAQMRYNDDYAVVHALIKINEDELIDYDSVKGTKLLNIILEYIGTSLGGTPQENQCALANYIWSRSPDIKVLKSSFAKTPSKVKMLKDMREKRIEFCVRDNIENIFGICQIPIPDNIILKLKKEMEVVL